MCYYQTENQKDKNMCNYPILFVEGYMNCKENIFGMKRGKKKKGRTEAEKNDKIFWAKFVPRITSIIAEAILTTTFFLFFFLFFYCYTHFISYTLAIKLTLLENRRRIVLG